MLNIHLHGLAVSVRRQNSKRKRTLKSFWPARHALLHFHLVMILKSCQRIISQALSIPIIHSRKKQRSEEFEELKQFLSSTLSSFDKLASLPKYYGSEVQKCDQETLDVLHKIEFCNVSASDGYKLYKQLQEIRVRRERSRKTILKLQVLFYQLDCYPV